MSDHDVELGIWLEAMQRRWLFGVGAVGSLLCIAGAIPQFVTYDVPLAGWALVACAPLMLGMATLTRTRLPPSYAFHGLGAVLVGTLAVVGYARGGYHLVLQLYLFVLPLGALMLRLRREALVWLAVVLTSQLAIHALEVAGLTPARIAASATADVIGGVAVLFVLTAAGFHGVGNLERREQQVARVERELARQRRLEVLGRLAGGIAHDFNNLLAIISAHAEDPDPAAWEESRHAIQEAVHRGAGLTHALLAAAHERPEPARVVDAGEVTRTTAALLRRVLPETIELALEIDLDAHVEVDERELGHALLNLCLNARDAMPRGGRLDLRCDAVTLPAEHDVHPQFGSLDGGDLVRLTVQDEGVGIDPHELELVFEPFRTSKPDGTGLGLHRVRQLVEASGGALALRSTTGQTTVELYLPRAAAPRRRQLVSAERPSLSSRGLRVLVVEDEELVRRAIARLLRTGGFVAEAVGDPREALALTEREAFDVVLSDVLMPGMTGPELARALEERGFEGGIVLMTGYAKSELDDVAYPVLLKPIDREVLLETIREAAREPAEEHAARQRA